MLSVGWTEMMVIGVVVLIVIGPRELPATMRAIGKFAGKLSKMAGEMRAQLDEAMKEAELEDIRNQVVNLRNTARSLNPANIIKDELMSAAKTAEGSAPVSPPLTKTDEPPILPTPSRSDEPVHEPPAPETLPPDSGGAPHV
jgi:sec-independent protein translocase protein TatB